MTPFETFGAAAQRLETPTLIAGRHRFQRDGERAIATDLIAKLALDGTGKLLEIGCGVGTLLNPLAEHVADAIGIDHPACLARYRERGVPKNISLLAGEWPAVRPTTAVDRVLVYSVLHYLPDAAAAERFIRECIAVLRPGGMLLLGDLPNEDRRRRFLESEFGKTFQAQWAQQVAHAGATNVAETALRNEVFSQMDRTGAPYITDDFILRCIADARRQGHDAHLLPQPAQLPFSYTREDVLICKSGCA